MAGNAWCPVCYGDQPVEMGFKEMSHHGDHECVYCGATYIVTGEDNGDSFSFWCEHEPRQERALFKPQPAPLY